MSAVTAPTHNHATGTTAPGFEDVRAEFERYLADDPHFSAQLAVYWKSQLVVDLAGGDGLGHDTLTGTFSATKGVAAIALGTLIRSGALDLDQTVVHYWPEFGAHGKERILVRELLSHQAGLVNVDDGLDNEDILDSRRAAPKLAAQRPHWRPGTAFGYHGITIGTFMEELVRRITGQSLQGLYEESIRAPRGIDFWLSLPSSQEGRYEALRPAQPTAEQLAIISQSPMAPDGLGALMFNGVNNLIPPNLGPYSPNLREVRAAGPAALGGIGSARGLAQVYAAAIGLLGEALLDPDTVAEMGQQQVWGVDRVLNFPAAFGIVFMKPHPGSDFGSFRAFGHDGAGGALGYADPLYDLSFGYIPLQMQLPGGADARALHLSQTVRSAIRQS
ncbi:serine hydrolase domain-containing protein [Pseudarthrobacter sulfonivorans]|uniref:serine hydrolase domain-containing protein n=1 Tax=Pseudarthrobacter sulfonivorans TaxID=121292 RepID=UPI0027856A67|nr:serine hydrolase domain-containing protein [Pseudarthrobacter sulfonivorans]MDQ0000591.1 CubicO group peptidase (beta-lactamase class C family) [Pseudarthrobacter sulfonivorans]